MNNQLSIEEQFLSQVHQIITNNIDNENFSVETLAEEVHLSRSMLHRRLVKITGKSAIEIITEIRLNHAKELLEHNTVTASEVAYKVGFKNPSYFNTVFKKHFGISPGAMRKAGQGNYNNNDIKLSRNNRKVISRILLIVLIVIMGVGIFIGIRFIKTPERSIAVIPLNNFTGSGDNDYFVDGMHDALIGELSHIKSVRVISRTSTLRYRNTNKLLPEIAKELKVNTIVEGSVISMNDSLRITLQLIDIYPKERHLFAKEYKANFGDVLNVQSAMVRDITKKIRVKLYPEEAEKLERKREVNPETYKDYLRGMYYLNQGTPDSFKKGIGYLHGAIDRDPADPFAYAGLALGYSIMGHGQFNTEEAFNRALAAAKKAISIDPYIDDAHVALSLLYLYKFWDWPLAETSFNEALQANPNNEMAHAHAAWYYILFDDMDKSIIHAEKAALLDPLSASYSSWLALLYFYNKQYDKAHLTADKTLDLQHNHPYAHLVLSWVYLQQKKYSKALSYCDSLPNYPYWEVLKADVYCKAGERDFPISLWNRLDSLSKQQWINPCQRGFLAASLGYTDKAFELLNTAFKNKNYPITYVNFYPSTESIRSDPRYNELLLKLKLPHSQELITSK